MAFIEQVEDRSVPQNPAPLPPHSRLVERICMVQAEQVLVTAHNKQWTLAAPPRTHPSEPWVEVKADVCSGDGLCTYQILLQNGMNLPPPGDHTLMSHPPGSGLGSSPSRVNPSLTLRSQGSCRFTSRQSEMASVFFPRPSYAKPLP